MLCNIRQLTLLNDLHAPQYVTMHSSSLSYRRAAGSLVSLPVSDWKWNLCATEKLHCRFPTRKQCFFLFFVLIQCTVVVLSLLPAPSPACGRLQSVCGGRESVRLKVNFLLKDPCENELRCDHRVRFRESRPTERPVLLTGNHDSLRLRGEGRNK